MTAAMKNLVGLVPLKGYQGRQSLIPHTRATLDETIVDLNLLHRVDFVVSDLIVGLEYAKSSSWGGRPVRMNTILASTDVVAVDAVSAQLIGLNPDDVEYLTLAQMRGVGVEDPDRIEVKGENLARIARRFEKMPTDADKYGQTPKIWTIKGLFPAKGPKEEFLDPSKLSVVPGQDGWSEPTYFSSDKMDLKKHWGKPRNCIAYTYTDFTAPRDEPAELWVGSGEAMTIWIDGEEVYRFEGRRKHRVPSDKKRIRLTKGRHGLLVKVYQTFGAFDFSLNICEAEDDPRYAGNRVKGLTFRMPEGGKVAELPAAEGEAEMEPFDIVDWVTQNAFSMEILKVYGPKEGLPSGRVEGIALDPDGRLWVAMRSGIYHQTGDTTWTAYTKDDGLPEGWIGSLVVHPTNGDVWAVIRSRLVQFTDGKWEQHFPDVWHGDVYVDDSGVVWAASFGDGVRRYDGRDWKSYKTLDEENDWPNRAECVYPDAKGAVWIGMWGYGVGRFDGNVWKIFMVRDGLADNHPRVLRIAPNGDVWVGFNCPGMSRYNGKKWKSFYDKGAPNEGTSSMLITRDGTVWIGTWDETLSRYDGKRWATATCTHSIQDMFEDQDGRIWMAVGNSVVVASLR